MRFVDKVDMSTKNQQHSTPELRPYHAHDDIDDDIDDDIEEGGGGDSTPQGLGMDLKLFFDFGPLLGSMSLVRSGFL